MAKAKKLPSGSWWVQVYESFTSDDPSPAGRREAELAASEFALNKDKRSSKVKLTLGEALDNYIESRSATRSPRTIMDYECTRRNYLQGLMDKQLLKITQDDIQ